MIVKNVLTLCVYPLLNTNYSLVMVSVKLKVHFILFMNWDMKQSLGVNMEWLQLGLFVCAMTVYKVDERERIQMTGYYFNAIK